MQFSEAWLRSLVNPALSTAELGHMLTMAGLEVEADKPVAPAFDRVVVAEILAAEKHPNADRLQVCSVHVGGAEPLRIVCGAPNARAGLKTACALVGAELPGNFTIKQAKVRGVESFGMLCSAKELGIAEAADGIMELAGDAPVGTSLRDLLQLDDRLVTLKLTPNRGDCLSLQGIAREVAAITGAPLTPVDCAPVAAVHDDTLDVAIAAPEACPRYCGRVIKGIDPTAKTPDWLVRRLERSELRAIHPVVDVTNYVMLELGEPMHAFDLEQLQGGIQARPGRPGEKLELLNGQTIELSGDTLCIADDARVLALAGIMGGQGSGVAATTRDIFLEAAHFTPAAIAGRARRFGLNTDSAHRFERGVDPALTATAMERATRLILDICGGRPGPVVVAGPGTAPPQAIRFRPERARALLGMAIDDAEIEAALSRLGLGIDKADGAWNVRPPSHRFDLEIEVDLIEEVARLKGYDNIPARPPRGDAALMAAGEDARGVIDLKDTLVALGYQEIVTYSFISSEAEAEIAPGRRQLPLLNPIASQLGVMRSSLLPGLLQTLRYNLNYGQERMRLFEFGRVFEGATADAQPLRVAGLAYGSAQPEQWAEKTRGVDFFDIKGDFEALFAPLAVACVAASHPALHPGQCARLSLDGAEVGWLGALHPKLVQEYGLTRAPMLFEVDWQALARRGLPRHRGVSRFPAVRRDIAVVVDAGHRLGTILEAARAALPETITEISAFDVYQGPGIESGKKSLAFRMLLQHTEKTLTDAEIEASVGQVVGLLAKGFGAVLRG
jgi:phenylalanyl-tRNA synthetase beta chain